MKAFTRRDLTIVPLESSTLVIACDSCGAVGSKDGDVLKLPPYYVGKFTSRVALTEGLCSGAKPITITNGVACEMHPTGEELISGIRDELENAGFSDIVLTGSTEDNFKTNMTALAVTVVGINENNDLKFQKAQKGDKLILLGRPMVGSQVDLDNKGFYTQIKQLISLSDVKEIVPVGSKGIKYEAEFLAKLSDSDIVLYKTDVDYNKSAGPATCLLVLCADTAVKTVLFICETATIIGEIL